jgi:glutathione S-transferase
VSFAADARIRRPNDRRSLPCPELRAARFLQPSTPSPHHVTDRLLWQPGRYQDDATDRHVRFAVRIDDQVGPSRALLPASGASRREAYRLIALAIGAGEKARDQLHERMVRPPEKYHEPWVARCREQMHGALEVIETHCRETGCDAWLVDSRFSQADITVTCIATFLSESLEVFAEQPYPMLKAQVERCEALPEFRATHSPWFAAAMRA